MYSSSVSRNENKVLWSKIRQIGSMFLHRDEVPITKLIDTAEHNATRVVFLVAVYSTTVLSMRAVGCN